MRCFASRLLRCFVGFCVAASMCAAATAAEADAAYPSRPLRLIVPFPPGGGSDVMARLVATRLGEALRQPVVVDNRAGASTVIGAEMAARSAPDGYTLILGNLNTFVTNPLLFKTLGYNPAKDFTLLGMPARFPFFLVASPASHLQSVAGLIARAKAEPGKLTYASPGPGSPHHLYMELLKQRAEIDIAHIPYKGLAPALQDLLPGRIDVMLLDYAGGAGLIKEGKLKVLAAAGDKRSSLMPDVPTLAESGLSGYAFSGWQGLAMPSGAPPAIVAKLRKAVDTTIEDPVLQAQLKAAGFDPTPMSADVLESFVQSERAKLGQLIRTRGITLE